MIYHAFRLKKNSHQPLSDSITVWIIKLVYFVKNKALFSLSRILFSDFRKIKVEKVLILRMGSLGDTVTAAPAFTAIRNIFPSAEIDLLTNKFLNGKAKITEILPEKFFRNIYHYEKFVDRCIVDQIKLKKYDLYVEMPSYDASIYFELRSLFLAFRTRIKSAAGFHVSSDSFLLEKQKNLFVFENNFLRLLHILNQYHLKNTDTGWLLWNNSVELPEFNTEKYLKTYNTFNGIIALVPGAGLPEKKWPVKNFKEVAEKLWQKKYRIIIVGGEQDIAISEEIINDIPDSINFSGKLSVLETALILNKTDLVVSNDTGSMHLAYAVGKPVIALYTNRECEGKWYPPYDGKNIVIRSDNLDIGMIRPEVVFKAACQILLPKNESLEV